MVDRHLHFAANLQWQPREHLESVDDAAIGAVLDGDHAVFGVAAIHFLEDRGDAADGNEIGIRSETFDGCQMRKAIGGPEVHHSHALNELTRAADHFAENRADSGGW